MNLELTRELLTAATRQAETPYRVSERDATREVELLADAGFVDAALVTIEGQDIAIIKRVTTAGKKLLNVLAP
ncbi:MAG: hypothetical protein ABIR71_12220 [Chthoniobacterales bacterium]